jgi:hypothetical protein
MWAHVSSSRKTYFLCIYVDDAICLTLNNKTVNNLIKGLERYDLERCDYMLTHEGLFLAYVGIQVDNLNRNFISTQQPAFIEMIIECYEFKNNQMHNMLADGIVFDAKLNTNAKTIFIVDL